MKKVLLLLLLVLALSGCVKKENLSNSDIDNIFNTLLSANTKLVNNSSTGYKYYLPTGVKVVESSNYNEKLYFNGYYYYLYVDVVSYHYKIDSDYDIDNNIYYSKELNYNDKKGYIEITEKDDMYNIVFLYNYSKIETVTDYNNLKQTLINASYILNSIKYNDKVIELSVGEDRDKLKEEVFDFYTPRKEGNFIDYINEYDEYEEEVPDENNIGNEE